MMNISLSLKSKRKSTNNSSVNLIIDKASYHQKP